MNPQGNPPLSDPSPQDLVTDAAVPPGARVRRVLRVAAPRQAPRPLIWGLYALAFCIPFEYGFAIPGVLTLTRVVGLGFFVCCMFYPRQCFRQPRRDLWWFGGFLMLYALHGLAVAPERQGMFLGSLKTLGQLMILGWLVTNLLRSARDTRRVLLALALAAGLLSVLVLGRVGGFAGVSKERNNVRLTAQDNNPNYLAYITGCAAVIMVGTLLNRQARGMRLKAILLASVLPVCAMTAYTGSRTGLGGLLLGLSIYLVPFGGNRSRLTAFLWGLFAIAMLGVIVTTNTTSSSRVSTVYTQGSTAGGRGEIFLAALGMIAERPLFGWHPAEGVRELGRRLNLDKRSAHNLYLQIGVDVGLSGAMVFLAGLGRCVRRAWKSRTGPFGLMPLALLTTVMANNMAHDYLMRKPTWFVLAVVIAIVSLEEKRQVLWVLRRPRNTP